MGAIGGLLGTSGGANGTGYSPPGGTPILSGTDAGQLQTAYGGAQNSLQSQQALLQALQAQGGLGNQSQVYGQLQGVANGTGPNPAQAMLNQATSQNVANQAALMAGQRGAGANVGLMARQAAQQGAGIQQQAVGQGATMQANQALNAMGMAGNMANIQAGQQIAGTGANTQAQMAEQQMLQNAAAQQNNANVGMQSNINNANAGLAGGVMQGQQALIGGLMGGAGAGMGMMGGGAQGSAGAKAAPIAEVAAQGGVIGSPGMGPQSSAARFMSGMAQGGNVGSQLKAGGRVPGNAQVSGNSYSNDTVNAKLSPGELVVDRETMADQGPAGQAARFLAAIISKKKGGK